MKKCAAGSSLASCVLLFLLLDGVAAITWKLARTTQIVSAPPLSANDLDYFANQIKNEGDLKKHVKKILIPRVPGTKGSDIVREYIVSNLTDLGYDISIVSSTQKTPEGDLPFHNIVATLDPEAPRRLVLACHYDSKKTPIGFLGATDSAVPCAQMLNLAYTMRRDLQEYSKGKPQLTLQLIFFDGEESIVSWQGTDNTYGARDLASKWHGQQFSYQGLDGNELDRIDVFVLLDLIGASNPTFVALQEPTVSWFDRLVDIETSLKDRGDFARPGGNKPQNVMFVPTKYQKNFNAGVEDDHIHFLRKGVPILHLICVPFPSVWHKMSDNESAIDYAAVEDLNKIFRVFVAEYLNLSSEG